MATKEQEVMSTGDALNEIAKMKNITRAFERAGDVMTAVGRAEGRKTELEAEIKTLDDQKAKWKAYADGQEAAMAGKQKAFEDQEKALAAKLAQAKQKFDADMAAINQHYHDTSLSARDSVAADIKAEQEKVDALVAERGNLQRDVRMLKAEIDALEQKKAVL